MAGLRTKISTVDTMNGNSTLLTKFTKTIPISNRYMKGVVTAAVCNTNLEEKNHSMPNIAIVRLVKSFTARLSNGQQYSARKTLTSHMDITTWVGTIVERKLRSINCLAKRLVHIAGAQSWTREGT